MTIKARRPDRDSRPSECVGRRTTPRNPRPERTKPEELPCASLIGSSPDVEHHRGVALEVSAENSDVSSVAVTSKTPELLPSWVMTAFEKRYDIMPVAGRVCEIEDALWRGSYARRVWFYCRRAAEERDELTSPHNPLRETQPAMCCKKLSTDQPSAGPAHALQPTRVAGTAKSFMSARSAKPSGSKPGSQESSQPDASAAIDNTRPGGAGPLT
jgi:hypothetical protein